VKILRQLHKWMINPFSTVVSPHDRLRAEILTWLTVIRQIVLVGLTIYLENRQTPNLGGLIFADVANIVFFGMARSRYYKLAAVLMIAEPLVVISQVAMTTLSVTPDLQTAFPQAMMAPPWLVIGSVIACLVLPLSWALGVIVGTVAAFAFIYVNVNPYYRAAIVIEFSYTFAISCFAFLGAVLRQRADQALEVEQARVLQSAKLASLGEMASGVAHELNTPLNAIMLNVEITQAMANDETTKPGDFKDYLVEVDEISQRMARIIRGMKEFSRDAANSDFETVPPRLWIEDALRLCQQRFRSSSVRIELVPNRLLSNPQRVQPTQLSQVVLNLLNNAFDAVQKYPEKWVRIETRVHNGFFELRVEDSGSGIPEDVAVRLFQPFFTTKDYGHGTGLGLSISKGIARRHGGELFLDRDSLNTCFVLKLPLAESNAPNRPQT
jgi:signal transduction histidine kinase